MNGFITLENGEDFSIRWTGYDEIIRIAIKELSFLDNSNELAEWLDTQVPNENEDDGNFVPFYKENGEMILRIIDVRGLTTANRLLFWTAVENGEEKLLRLGNEYSILNPIVITDLMEMHQTIPDNIEIFEENAEYIVTNNDVIKKIGPGW
ncbi:hypothetical protein ACFFGT_32290 [Mucilaginibacter angelicae]|uniref:Phage protein n=1 Tax=Mucilaginibacter angelicae TaxID=869718 RepID=A0ABV6LHI1_9SPHI